MGPRAFDEFSAAAALPLLAMGWAVANHPPPAQEFEIAEELVEGSGRPPPKPGVSACLHDFANLL